MWAALRNIMNFAIFAFLAFVIAAMWAGVPPDPKELSRYTFPQLVHIIAAKIDVVTNRPHTPLWFDAEYELKRLLQNGSPSPAAQASAPTASDQPGSTQTAQAATPICCTLLAPSLPGFHPLGSYPLAAPPPGPAQAAGITPPSAGSVSDNESIPRNEDILAAFIAADRLKQQKGEREDTDRYQRDLAEERKYLANPNCCTGWQASREATQSKIEMDLRAIEFYKNPARNDMYSYSISNNPNRPVNYEGNIIAYVTKREKGTDNYELMKVSIRTINGRVVVSEWHSTNK